jgi:orotate phosphoribosyltransferase
MLLPSQWGLLFTESTRLNQHFLKIDRRAKQPVSKGVFYMKEELIQLLCKKSFQYDKEPVFKLASGKMSHFYINCRPVTLNPQGMYLIGHLVFETIKDVHPQGVGGLTFGADPIAMATSFVSWLKHQPMKAFSIRKTQKDHGIVKWIEGDICSGDKVAIVEDVATTGGSTIKAIERARSEGLIVERVVVLVDRQEGGLDNIKALVPDVVSIITREELVAASGHK